MERQNRVPEKAFSGTSAYGFRKPNRPTESYNRNDFLKSSVISESSSSGFKNSNKPTKGFTDFVHTTRDFPSGLSSNVAKNGQQKGLSKYHWRRKVGAVKTKLGGDCEEDRVSKIPKEIPRKMVDNNRERNKVLEMLELYRKRCDEISRNGEENTRRIDYRAIHELKNEGKIRCRCSSIIGAVEGVEIGDRFRYRVELVIVGLHKHYERGIDYIVYGGRHIATCVIAMEEHCDKMSDPNVLIYKGEGGKGGSKEVCDQQLSAGNLALYESMKQKSVVRVVKGYRKDVYNGAQRRLVAGSEYIYDGLYEVISCEKKHGLLRKMVFEFKLSRCPGQAAVSCRNRKRNRI